jgi:hypothetical protein
MTPMQMELHAERKARLERMGGWEPIRQRSAIPPHVLAPKIEPEPVKPLWFRPLSDRPWYVVFAEGMVRPSSETEPESPKGLRIADIQRVVAEHFDTTLLDLKSARRTAAIVRPRQIAMYLARKLTSKSLPEIGRRSGGRDHTTVLHAITVCERILKDEEELAPDIRELFAKLKPKGNEQ